MSNPQNKHLEFEADNEKLRLYGDWTVIALNTEEIHQFFQTLDINTPQKLTIDAEGIQKFDSAGALSLQQILDYTKQKNIPSELIGLHEEENSLLQLIKDQQNIIETKKTIDDTKNPILYQIGEETAAKVEQADGLIMLIGDLTTQLFEACRSFKRFHFASIVTHIDTTGLRALPIVGLLSFLIGVVLAYQMGLQLQTYGANIFIAYLSGMAIFREFGPLITAIIVAGRTSSSFTAQIGSMKINEEIDALETMGLSPTEYLVVPKLLALLFVFPLLIFWANTFSILGAMYMSKVMLDVSYLDFLARLKDSVGLKQFMLGIYKAPAFALIIVLVGCFQGFAVKANSDSIGTQTTKSVVQALFLIIVADAAFSVVYSWLGI